MNRLTFPNIRKKSDPTTVWRLVLLTLLLAGAALAQTIPEISYSQMRWRNIGPFRAGRALAACGIPGNASAFFFGAVDGGVWKTVNAGHTWEQISDGQVSPSIGALAIAPSDEKIMYAGTGEADMRSDITYGDGVYKTTDGGKTWRRVGLDSTRHIGKILIDPRNPNVALVAAVGHAYGSNKERGIFRTTNGGKSWENALYKNPETGAVDLAWDPQNPDVVYATLWQMRRMPWDQYAPEEGPGSGLYKSTDNGKTWQEITGHGLPEAPYGRIGLAVARGSAGNTVFAIISAKKEPGLYRSDDGGANWHFINGEPRITKRMWYFGRVFLDPQNANIVYIPSQGLLRSTDGGKNFTVIKSSPGGDDYHYLWVDPTNSSRIITASDQGAAVSLDDGRTWSSWYNQPTAQFYHVTTDNQFPYRVYGSQQDAGTVSITSRGDYGEITFRDWHPVGGGESGYIAVDPKNPDIVYGANVYGDLHRFDRRTGQFQVISAWPLQEFTKPFPKRKYRFAWTPPIIFDPRNQTDLYLGSHMLLRSEDGGLRWDAISPDLTGARSLPENFSEQATVSNATELGWGVIFSIAPSPLQAGLIWVGTDNGLIHLTRDGGKNWQNVTPRSLKPWSKISLIEASPFSPGVAYAAIDRHRLDDFAPYIYRTQDFGKSWTRIDKGIDRFAYMRVVRADPKKKGLLYAGAETGVYVSFDDGARWQSLQLNLPVVSVRDLAVRDDDLIAGTHGRAFWILDDLTPLQQLNPQVVKTPVHLFRPERAIRIRHSVNTDTPLPPEIPHGENPPAGAIIDYHLLISPSSPITLEILNERGKLIRKFSSADKPTLPAEPPYFMDAWLPRFKALTTRAGHNRFVWDLRYPSPPTKHTEYSMAANAGHGTVREPRGPLALPGKYQLKLIVDGKAHAQPLQVEMDPRVDVSEKALRTQLRLALQITEAIKQQNELDLQASALHSQLRKIDKSAGAAGVKPALSAAQARLDSLDAFLNDGGLSTLLVAVMSADRAPTKQMRDAFDELKARQKEAQQSWTAIRTSAVARLNRALKARKLTPVHFDLSRESQ